MAHRVARSYSVTVGFWRQYGLTQARSVIKIACKLIAARVQPTHEGRAKEKEYRTKRSIGNASLVWTTANDGKMHDNTT